MQDRARSSQIRRDHRSLRGRVPHWPPLSRPLPIFLLRLKIVCQIRLMRSCCGCLSQRLIPDPRFKCRRPEKILHVLLHFTPCPSGALCISLRAAFFLVWLVRHTGPSASSQVVKSKRALSPHHLRHPCINLVGFETTPTRPDLPIQLL